MEAWKSMNIVEIMNEYKPNCDIWTEDGTMMFQLKTALEALPPADKIIMLIYCECGSLRDAGKELGVSHTIIYKQIQKIKRQIYDYIKVNFDGNNSKLLDRFERCCKFN